MTQRRTKTGALVAMVGDLESIKFYRENIGAFKNDYCLGCVRSLSFTEDKQEYCCETCWAREKYSIPLSALIVRSKRREK